MESWAIKAGTFISKPSWQIIYVNMTAYIKKKKKTCTLIHMIFYLLGPTTMGTRQVYNGNRDNKMECQFYCT